MVSVRGLGYWKRGTDFQKCRNRVNAGPLPVFIDVRKSFVRSLISLEAQLTVLSILYYVSFTLLLYKLNHLKQESEFE